VLHFTNANKGESLSDLCTKSFPAPDC